MAMGLAEHARTTGGALKSWLVAQCQDSLVVGLLWLVGLYLLKVPWAPLCLTHRVPTCTRSLYRRLDGLSLQMKSASI